MTGKISGAFCCMERLVLFGKPFEEGGKELARAIVSVGMDHSFGKPIEEGEKEFAQAIVLVGMDCSEQDLP